MKADDLLAGPIIRRAQPEMVWIWLATTKALNLGVTIRPVRTTEWTGRSDVSNGLRVCQNLWIHLICAKPAKGKFPTGKLLEYSIAVVDADGAADHDPFVALVAADGLAYPNFTLPNFYLQAPGARLNAVYVSCRKPHDKDGGREDAMEYGDTPLVAENVEVPATRPTVLCLTGDQIYADDVHDHTFDAVTTLAAKLEGSAKEAAPKGLTFVPGKGKRKKFLIPPLTSSEAKNHLVTFAEYAAMYGLAWSRRNWPAGPFPPELDGFVSGLPKVRRLMANTPTYMIFDDHDVTDDWNLSLQWEAEVMKTPLGKRIMTNALYAFWLFQGWGNDPTRHTARLPRIVAANQKRLQEPELLEAEMAAKGTQNEWEFSTPTLPFIYFLDTRTQRGPQSLATPASGAPAWLRSITAWKKTANSLAPQIKAQGTGYPLVLVAAGPIWGYTNIERLQSLYGKVFGPEAGDQEAWSDNTGHLVTFLLMCSDMDIVVLSGDIHYSFTSTAKFTVFDSAFYRAAVARSVVLKALPTVSGSSPTYDPLYSARFVQLTSSAAKNIPVSARVAVTLLYAAMVPGGYSHIIDEDRRVWPAIVKAGKLLVEILDLSGSLVLGTLVRQIPVSFLERKPICALHQRVNAPGNSGYNPIHNIGYVSITGRKVVNAFIVKGKAHPSRTWDFASDTSWAPP